MKDNFFDEHLLKAFVYWIVYMLLVVLIGYFVFGTWDIKVWPMPYKAFTSVLGVFILWISYISGKSGI